VMLSESPLLLAFEQVNPGDSKLQRQTYQASLTAVATNWPTIYQDNDILIKDIP